MKLLVIRYVLVGMPMIGLSIPLIRRRVPPNRFYGFRTPRTLREPAIWYPINAYVGWLLLAVGIVTGGVSVILAFVPGIAPTTYKRIVEGVLLVGVLAMVVMGMLRLQSFR